MFQATFVGEVWQAWELVLERTQAAKVAAASRRRDAAAIGAVLLGKASCGWRALSVVQAWREEVRTQATQHKGQGVDCLERLRTRYLRYEECSGLLWPRCRLTNQHLFSAAFNDDVSLGKELAMHP